MQQEKLLNGTYKKYKKIGQGSSGKVYLAEKIHSTSNQNINYNNIQPILFDNLKSGRTFYAIKKLKLGNSKVIGQLKQLVYMQKFNHLNLVSLQEYFVVTKPYTQKHYISMQYHLPVMELFNMKQIKVSDNQLKNIMWQILSAVQYIHSKNYLHRDIKPSNILISKQGKIKLCDFSIATQIRQQMTGNTTTRLYRAPQLIFGHKKYGTQIDIWSLGCTFAQLLLHQPIFQGSTDINQLQKIFNILGYPNQQWPQAASSDYPYYLQFQTRPHSTLKSILPTSDKDLVDLIQKLLILNPHKRISINEIKCHNYFKNMINSNGLEELAKLAIYGYEKKIKQILK